MARKNIWALNSSFKNPQDALLLAGEDALLSGQISPEEAASNLSPVLKAAGVGSNPLLNAGINVNQPTNNPAVYSSTPIGSRKQSITKPNYRTPEELQELYETALQSPTIQEQQKGIQQMQDLLTMDTGGEDYFSGPLAGLAQFVKTGDARAIQAQAGKQGSSRDKLLAGLMKLQDEKKDLNKTIADYMRLQQAGQTTISEGTSDQADRENRLQANQLYQRVERHQKRMEPLQETLSTIEKLDDLVGGFEGKGKIPGVGPLQSMYPDKMLTDKGVAVRQAYTELQNQLLKLRSGASVTKEEGARLEAALGKNKTSDEREFRTAMSRFASVFRDIMKQREAGTGADPRVVKIYKEAGGPTASDLSNLGKEKKKSPSGLTPEEEKELAEYEAKYGGK